MFADKQTRLYCIKQKSNANHNTNKAAGTN